LLATRVASPRKEMSDFLVLVAVLDFPNMCPNDPEP
jgi:hypothetical protein